MRYIHYLDCGLPTKYIKHLIYEAKNARGDSYDDLVKWAKKESEWRKSEGETRVDYSLEICRREINAREDFYRRLVEFGGGKNYTPPAWLVELNREAGDSKKWSFARGGYLWRTPL